MNKVLVTGASGMLGATLSKILSDEFEIYATGNSSFEGQYKRYQRFDLKSSSYKRLIDWAQPNTVIHCAALTNGNECEKSPEIANLINGYSVDKFCKSVSADTTIIYISSDAVFSPSLSMANELDVLNPESCYGKSKRLGESYLEDSALRNYIIRTTIVGKNLNIKKKSFVEWVIDSSLSEKTITLFDDVIFTPISIWDLCYEIKFILQSKVMHGTYHISGSECISKYDFGIRLLTALNYPIKNIIRGSIESLEARAKRSNDQSLDSTKYTNLTRRKMPDIKKTINAFRKKYHEK